MNIIEARRDPELFGRMYPDPTSWRGWESVLRGVFALGMDRAERRIFKKLTGRRPPKAPVKEAWAIVGRRGGKTSTAAMIAAHAAAFRDYRPFLQAGEQAVVMLLSVDRAQCRVALGYLKAFFREIPMLAALVRNETRESLELTNGVIVEVHTNDFRHVRGRTVACAVFDEVAFWRDETSAAPDVETYNAVVPAMATIPNSMLIGISSPYRRAGLLWEKYQRHYGKRGDILVIRAPSRVLNPTLPKKLIDEALERDPAAASAEWLAEFRQDIEGYVSRESVEQCVARGRRELPYDDPADDYGRTYRAFCDPAGGSGGDSMTLAVTHKDKGSGRVILDCVREVKPKFSPAAVVAEFATVLKSYKIRVIYGDRYASEWPVERFRENGINYRPSDKVKSEIYLAFLPLLNSGKVELLDHPRLIAQLYSLERKTARGGRDSIDHPPSGHDDLINAVAGALLLAGKRVPMPRIVNLWANDSTLPPGHWIDDRGGYHRGLGT